VVSERRIGTDQDIHFEIWLILHMDGKRVTQARHSVYGRLRYTLPMKRVIFVCLTLPLFTFITPAQVKIHVPQEHQKKYESIRASVENTGKKPISFCIEFGQTSPKGEGQTEGCRHTTTASGAHSLSAPMWAALGPVKCWTRADHSISRFAWLIPGKCDYG
jgi:hypothetical protein